MSLGWKRENPPRERLGAGDAAAFSYDIGLFRGFQRALETDEVCGRPLDSFAFTSHVTMGKKRRGGTDDGSARGHSVQLSPTQSRERESRGSKTLWWGHGAMPIAASGQKRKIFLQKQQEFSRERRNI